MLEEKVCIVTGSGGGIGRATAIEMGRRGAKVIITDINDDNGAETVELVRAAGAEAEYVRCDVGEVDQVDALMAAAVKRFGGIDVLHNNAGIHETDISDTPSLLELAPEAFDKVISINLKAVWLAMRAAAPHLQRSTRGPAIVNAASTGGLTGYPMGSAYCSSKAGVMQLTRVAAIELAPTVRVNAYCPGAVDTPMVQKYTDAAEDPDAIVASMTGTHLIPRLGRPEEIAKLVCFLASEDSSFVNGASYVIDGGSTAWRGTR